MDASLSGRIMNGIDATPRAAKTGANRDLH